MESMKVGILGTGHMGNVHARQYRKMPDVELGYRDRNEERSASFQAKWNARPSQSAEELIQWADVVDICLPTDLHFEYALRAIESGKPVFLEKPIAPTLEQGAKIVETARKANVPLMIGQVVRYFPDFALGNRLVKQGAIGTPAAARTRRGGGAPQGSNDWFMDHSRSGGVLIDLAIHDFDWLRWTLGEVKHLYSRSVGAQSGFGPDYALTTLTFDCGAVAHVESTWMDPQGFRTTFEVAGSEGLIEYDSRQEAALRTATTSGTRLETPLTDSDDPYFLQIRAFLNAVQSNTPPPVSGEDGLSALSIALAALESAKTGRVIQPARF